jgi:hypothetical protein
MPRFGTLDVGTVAADLPHLSALAGPTWQLPDAEFLQINWEVDDAGALALTPPSLHPSIPPFASFFGCRFPDTPVGPFSIAQVRLVVRAGVRPRALCLGAVCDSPDAVTALRAHWGFPVQLGEIEVANRHDRVSFSAALDRRPVLELTVHTADVINGSDLMTFDNLHLVQLGDETGATLVQVDPEYTIHRADRGRPAVSLPDPEALGMQGSLRLASPIIGFSFRADSDLVPVRFTIDSTRPAVSSTNRVA